MGRKQDECLFKTLFLRKRNHALKNFRQLRRTLFIKKEYAIISVSAINLDLELQREDGANQVYQQCNNHLLVTYEDNGKE